MFYPEVNLEAWIKKHKLVQVEYLCPKCKEKFMTDRPFITADLVGLQSRVHDCGPNYWTAVMVPKRTEDREIFRDLI